MKPTKKQKRIVEIIRDGILRGKAPLAIRAEVARAYPKSALAKADDAEVPGRISWYRAKLKAEGVKVSEPKKSPKPTPVAAPKRRPQKAAERKVA